MRLVKLFQTIILGITMSIVSHVAVAQDSLRVWIQILPERGWYRFTSNLDEVKLEKNPSGWSADGEAFRLFPVGTQGTVPLHHYSHGTYGHFYTSNPTGENLTGWHDEGVIGNVMAAQTPDTVPLYRSKSNGIYYFSTDQLAGGFQRDGVCCYVLPIIIATPQALRVNH